MTKISRDYHVEERRIRTVLLKYGVEIRVPTRKKSRGWDYRGELEKKYPKKEGFHYEAVFVGDGKVFSDYLNTSGALTAYLEKNGLEVPSLFKRTKYFKANGKQWYEQWFDIRLVKDEEKKLFHCPYCEWTTADVENKSGSFLKHLLDFHNKTKEQYLKEFPEERGRLKLVNKLLDRQYETDKTKFVECKICGKKLARIDWRHLRSHGMTLDEYIARYGNTTISKELHDRLSETTRTANKNSIPKFSSKPETEIKEFLEKNGIESRKDRKILDGQEIDIFIPSLNIGIEYDGLLWHSEWFGHKTHFSHYNKTEKCLKKGVKLIHIFEDEYEYHRDIVYAKLGHILGLQRQLPKIMGRKCSIREVKKDEAEPFLDKNHIQGFADSKIHLGAYYQDKLVAVMSFKHCSVSGNTWELTRFASDNDVVCQGIGGKLFSYFIKNYNPLEIKSFADRRWTINENDNLYTKLGFENTGHTKPSYSYINYKEHRCLRQHKFGFRKQILHRRYGLPLTMTESQMTKKLGYDRVWDCGLIKYVWKRQ